MNNEEIKERTHATLKDMQKSGVSAILLVSLPDEGVQAGATHLSEFGIGHPGDSKLLEAIINLKLAISVDQMSDSNPMKKVGEMLLEGSDKHNPDKFQEEMSTALERIFKGQTA